MDRPLPETMADPSLSLELSLDQIAHEHGMTVIKESGMTGYSYTLLNKDDTWLFLLNHWDYTATQH